MVPNSSVTAPAAAPADAPAPTRASGRGRVVVRALAGIAVAGAFLYLTVRQLEWEGVRAAWRQVTPGPVVLGVALFGAGLATRIARWWLMLRTLAPGVPYRACVRPFLGSIAVNNTVPLRIGDAVRAVGFQGELGVAPARVVGTLVVERVLDMLVLLGLFFVGLLGVARGVMPPAMVAAGTAVFAALLGGVLVLMLAPRFVERLVARTLLGPLAGRAWAGRLRGAAEQFFGTLTQVLTPGRAVQLVALSVVAWALEGGLYAAVAYATGAGGRAAGPFFALATGTLATLLPGSPGHVGTFDYFATLGLTAYGAPRDAAAAFALLAHLALWLPSTVVGALCFAVPAYRRRASAAAPATEPA